MSALRAAVAAVSESMTPDGRLMRIRFRHTFDLLVTLLFTALAVGLAVGFQVVGRWARRSGWID